VRLEATGEVYVCLVDARGRQVVDEEILQAGSRTRTFTSRSFRSNFGNSNLRMRVNGRTYPVAQSSDPIGYELRPGRRPRRLSDGQRPDCSA
jgi:cytoskeleton protein RodZ